jgi:hypothetical protein
LVEDIAILGSMESCHDRIREYGETGITRHIVSCVSPLDSQQTYGRFTAKYFSF